MSAGVASELVGPVLVADEASRAVIAAIRELDPTVCVDDRGAYLRVSARGGCRLRREIVERILGRPFRMPGDLEALMPSFTGELVVNGDEARWEWHDR